jgi:hypothetical protein
MVSDMATSSTATSARASGVRNPSPSGKPPASRIAPFRSRPHVLDEDEAGGAARAQRGGHVVYLALREPEGVALCTCGRSALRLAVALEREAKQRADDRAQIFALVVEGEEISRLGILAYEQKVQDANGLVALQPFELVHNPALEIRLRGKADHHELDRSYLLRHR